MEFKDRLKIAMERKKLNKYRLSKLLNCPESTVRSWFKCKTPRAGYMKKLADILEVSPAWLQYGDEERGPTLNNRAIEFVGKIMRMGPEALAKTEFTFDLWYGEQLRQQDRIHRGETTNGDPAKV